MITYEYPFNERIRTLLRLGDLFENRVFRLGRWAPEHHARPRRAVRDSRSRRSGRPQDGPDPGTRAPAPDLLAFATILKFPKRRCPARLRNRQSSAALLCLTGKIGQYLRENDWLMSIKSRAAIPGGVCEFDLPSYHWWLHRPVDTRREALPDGWTRPMLPLRDAAAIVLRLLRSVAGRRTPGDLGSSSSISAAAAQMVRVTVTVDEPAIPEVSANKYFLEHPFHQAAGLAKSRPAAAARCRLRTHLLQSL